MKVRYFSLSSTGSVSLLIRNAKNGSKSFVKLDHKGKIFDGTQPDLDKFFDKKNYPVQVIGKEIIADAPKVEPIKAKPVVKVEVKEEPKEEKKVEEKVEEKTPVAVQAKAALSFSKKKEEPKEEKKDEV